MNIAERKIKLVEKILHLVNTENVDHIEKVLDAEILNDESIVAHTINGKEITLSSYIEKNERAYNEYLEGNFKTSDEIKEKFKASKKLSFG